MGNFSHKWDKNEGAADGTFDGLYVWLCVSRNKDNKGVEGFRPRTAAFVTDRARVVEDRWQSFCGHAIEGETCRLYRSVNRRDPVKVQNRLMHVMLDREVDFSRLEAVVAGIAAHKDCAAEKHWLIDFDDDDINHVIEFCKDVYSNSNQEQRAKNKRTPHGFAVILDHGCDMRPLYKKWGNVITVKKDDMLCEKWWSK